jgi:hypothetical protein
MEGRGGGIVAVSAAERRGRIQNKTARKKQLSPLFLHIPFTAIHCKKSFRFYRLFPAMESLVSDIPARDGKIANQLTPLSELTSDISLFSPTELNFILHIMYVDSTLNFSLCILLRRSI